jgi:tetrahydromethanopterin S-methyltransferase subunit B
MWSKLAIRLKNLRSAGLLTGGFTLISTGLGMRYGLWIGLLIAGLCAIAYEWHLSRPPT